MASIRSRSSGAHAGLQLWWRVLVLLWIVMLVSPSGAHAHAALAESDPDPNAIVPDAPAEVTMTFTEPLEWSYTTADLYDEDGELVPGTTARPGATEFEMVLELPSSLPDGTYSVLWRTLSTADGHTAQNYFAFTVGSEADVAAVLAPAFDDTGSPGWQQTVARWTALLGLAAITAVWPAWMFVVRPGLAPHWRVARRATRGVRRFAVAAFVLALVGDLLALLVQASALDGAWQDRLVTTLGETRFGELWLMRVGLLLALGYGLLWVAWWWPFRRPIRAALVFALAFACPIPFSLISHASAQTTGRGVAIFNDYVHLVAASMWIGGLLLMAVVVGASLRGQAAGRAGRVLAAMLPRFSVMALTAWVVMILSGVYSAWLHIGSLDALTDTAYGQRLMLKLGLLVPILLLAAFNLLVVTRRVAIGRHTGGWVRHFGMAVAAEAMLAVLVLLVVGSLTVQAPARESVGAASDGIETELAGGDREATVTVSPGSAGPNRIDVAFGAPLPDSTEVLLRVEHDDQETGEKEIALAQADEGQYVYRGSELSLPGAWNLELIVRPAGAVEERLHGEVELASGDHASHVAAEGPGWVLASPVAVFGMVAMIGGTLALFVARYLRRQPSARMIGAAGLIALIVGVAGLLVSGSEPVAAAVAVWHAIR